MRSRRVFALFALVACACDGPSTVIGFHSGMRVLVRGGAQDPAALAAELNSRLARIPSFGGLKNADTRVFVSDDEGARLETKLFGDDWDLAIFLESFIAVSLGRPELRFAIELFPDGRRLRLESGELGRNQREVATFLIQQRKRRRPNLEGAFDTVLVHAQGTRQALSALASTAELPVAAGVPNFVARAEDGAMELRASYTGGARELAFLVDVVEAAWRVAIAQDPALTMTLRLTGRQRWERVVRSAAEWDLVARELRVATGRVATPSGPNSDSVQH